MKKWGIVRYITILFLLASVLSISLVGWSEDGFRLSIRASARIAVIFFCLAFGASSLHYFIKNDFTKWLLSNRKYLGVTFAVIHLIHLLTLVILQFTFHPIFEIAAGISLIGGGLAYFFTIGMLITSFTQYKFLLPGKAWSIFHTMGGYWIWFIFVRTYSRAIFREEYTLMPLWIMLIVVILLRIIKRILMLVK
jgi:hypothetical protein